MGDRQDQRSCSARFVPGKLCSGAVLTSIAYRTPSGAQFSFLVRQLTLTVMSVDADPTVYDARSRPRSLSSIRNRNDFMQ